MTAKLSVALLGEAGRTANGIRVESESRKYELRRSNVRRGTLRLGRNCRCRHERRSAGEGERTRLMTVIRAARTVTTAVIAICLVMRVVHRMTGVLRALDRRGTFDRRDTGTEYDLRRAALEREHETDRQQTARYE